jgi:hypothetical protein
VELSPLYAVLAALEAASGPLTLAELSLQLEIEPGALQGMVAFWVRKGRLRLSGQASCDTGVCGACTGAQGAGHCPALLVVPRRYEVVRADAREDEHAHRRGA